MLEKTLKFLEAVLDLILNCVKTALWMFIVTAIMVLFICSGFVAMIYQISTN